MRLINILQAEGCEGDILLIRDAIEGRGIAHKPDVAENGYEAMQYLNKVDKL